MNFKQRAYKVVYECQGNAELNSQDKYRVEQFETALRSAYEQGLEDAAKVVSGWHYKKGGYEELSQKIRQLKERSNG